MQDTVADTQRLFLAISAVSLDQALAPWIRKLKIGAERKEIFVKWTPAENRHITLLFLGPTLPEQRSALEAKVTEIAAGTAPLNLKIEDIGAFPDMRSGRVVWLGVQNSRKLRALRDRLLEPLRDQGFALEETYTPHFTIGRLRNPKSLVDFLSPMARVRIGKLEVRELVLYESITAGPFPIYKPLSRFPLTGSPETDLEESPSESGPTD